MIYSSKQIKRIFSLFLTLALFVSAGFSQGVAFAATSTPTAAKNSTVSTVVNSAPKASVSSINVTEQNDFVLEPGKVEVFLNPGETVTRSILVTNRIKRKVSFRVITEDFVGSRDPNQAVILLGDDKSPRSFKDNLKPAVQDFTLDFGQRISIPVQITAPINAEPGGLYASVIISNQPDKEELTQNTTNVIAQNRIISRLGVLFFIRINGDAKENGNVKDFRIAGPSKFIRQSGPTTFEVLFNNSGSIHLVPYGTVDVTNIFGQKLATLPIDAYFSLPDSLRSRTVEWEKVYLLGRYKATLHLNRGYGNIIDERVLTFWVIPWKILAAIFGVILVGVSFLYYISTRFEFKRKS